MREIVIDTETIGLDFHADRIVEIGTVELIKRSPTGKTFHHYLCPLRERRGRCARPDGPWLLQHFSSQRLTSRASMVPLPISIPFGLVNCKTNQVLKPFFP